MDKDLDIVIYGATGFTGKLCLKYLLENNKDTNIAIAGRNEEKLRKISENERSGIEILVAEGSDRKALDKITSRTKVILSTAGPFHRYSSELVASCIDNFTHYVDITGENFWVKQLIDKHHASAAEKGIRIIPSCGYDSLPSDLGTFFAVKHMKKPINRVESFHTGKGGISGGTSETMFSMGDLNLGKEMMDPFLLNPSDSVTNKQRDWSSDRVKIKKNKYINAWTGPFIMAFVNTRVVRRSAALFSERQESYGLHFVYQENAFFQSAVSAYLVTFASLLSGLILYTPLRKLFRPLFPKPGEGPDELTMENGFFDCMFLVKAEDGEKRLYRMHGKGDPGYRVTSKLVCESALTLIHTADSLPGGKEYGGILTPSTGLGEALISRLKTAGIKFENLEL